MGTLAEVIGNVKQSNLVKDLRKGGDQATSIYKIAKKSKKVAKDWRIKLSGVLSEQQIVFSLMVIGLFYFCYVTSNYFFRHKRDEDFVTENCHCKDPHRHLYRSLYWIYFVVWLAFYSFTFYDEIISKEVCPKCEECSQKFKHCLSKCVMSVGNGIIAIICMCCKCIVYIFHCIRRRICSNNTNSKSNPNNSEDVDDSDEVIKAKIQQLWFYYYKLYVLGYKKDYNDWPIYVHKETKEAETNTEPVAVGGNNVTSDQGHTNQNHEGSTDTTTEQDNPTLEHSSNNVDGSSCTPNEPIRNGHHENEHKKDTAGSRNDNTTTANTGT